MTKWENDLTCQCVLSAVIHEEKAMLNYYLLVKQIQYFVVCAFMSYSSRKLRRKLKVVPKQTQLIVILAW
jgi:hypothetical protein